jgi:hypothetical protein
MICCQVYRRQTKTRLDQSRVFLERQTQRQLTALHVGQAGEPFGFSQDHSRWPSHWADRSRLLNGRPAGRHQSSAPPALERARPLSFPRRWGLSRLMRQHAGRSASHSDAVKVVALRTVSLRRLDSEGPLRLVPSSPGCFIDGCQEFINSLRNPGVGRKCKLPWRQKPPYKPKGITQEDHCQTHCRRDFAKSRRLISMQVLDFSSG